MSYNYTKYNFLPRVVLSTYYISSDYLVDVMTTYLISLIYQRSPDFIN
jgi:hypothetical protein